MNFNKINFFIYLIFLFNCIALCCIEKNFQFGINNKYNYHQQYKNIGTGLLLSGVILTVLYYLNEMRINIQEGYRRYKYACQEIKEYIVTEMRLHKKEIKSIFIKYKNIVNQYKIAKKKDKKGEQFKKLFILGIFIAKPLLGLSDYTFLYSLLFMFLYFYKNSDKSYVVNYGNQKILIISYNEQEEALVAFVKIILSNLDKHFLEKKSFSDSMKYFKFQVNKEYLLNYCKEYKFNKKLITIILEEYITWLKEEESKV